MDATLAEAFDRGARHRLVRAEKQPFSQPRRDASCVMVVAVDKIYLQPSERYIHHEKEVLDLQTDEALCHVFQCENFLNSFLVRFAVSLDTSSSQKHFPTSLQRKELQNLEYNPMRVVLTIQVMALCCCCCVCFACASMLEAKNVEPNGQRHKKSVEEPNRRAIS